MSVDLIRYDLLVQDALRAVVRRVLTDVARDGLPGDHHLYISFDTTAPGVRLSPRLKERYPEEMTIVLQHQFWDLIVTEVSFEVGLSFNGIPERLFVPFASLKGFFDPSVKFGLQFEPAGVEEDDAPEAAPAPVAPIAMTRPTSVPNTSVPVTKPAATAAPAKAEVRPAARAEGKPKGEPAADARSAAKPAPSKPAEIKRPHAPAAVQEPKDGTKESTKDEPKDEHKSDTPGGAQVVRLDAFRKK
jgi:hypothetical protein